MVLPSVVYFISLILLGIAIRKNGLVNKGQVKAKPVEVLFFFPFFQMFLIQKKLIFASELKSQLQSHAARAISWVLEELGGSDARFNSLGEEMTIEDIPKQVGWTKI